MVREQCILNNNSRGFIFRDQNNKTYTKNSAVKKILKYASDLESDKNLKLEDIKLDSKHQGIKYYLQLEGNNVCFLSSYVSNVVIRWNANLDYKTLQLNYNKSKQS